MERHRRLEKFAEEQTLLSKERTLLSKERTVLTEISVFIAVIALGFGLVGFFEHSRYEAVTTYLGIFVILLGVLGILLSIRGYRKYSNEAGSLERSMGNSD